MSSIYRNGIRYGNTSSIAQNVIYDNTESNLEAENMQEAVDELNSKFSHVGMVIHSTTLDTMEKVIEIYGGTTWEKIEGRFLLGQSSSYAINSTGGEATHTLSANEIPQHRHTIPALSGSTNEKGAHTHNVQTEGLNLKYTTVLAGAGAGLVGVFAPSGGTAVNTASNGAHTHTVTTTANNTGYIGSSGAHNNMPPYKTVYIWERTA